MVEEQKPLTIAEEHPLQVAEEHPTEGDDDTAVGRLKARAYQMTVGAVKEVIDSYKKEVVPQKDDTPETLRKKAAQPYDPVTWLGAHVLKGMGNQSLDQLKKGKAEWDKGNHSGAVGHALAAVLPAMALVPGAGIAGAAALGAPMTANAAEELPEHPGAALVDMAIANAPLAAPVAAKAAKAVLPESVTIPPLAPNRNPTEAAAVDFVTDRGVPVSAGTATGNPVVRGAQHVAEKSTVSGSLVGTKAGAAHDAALEGLGRDLATDVNVPGRPKASETVPTGFGPNREQLPDLDKVSAQARNEAFDRLAKKNGMAQNSEEAHVQSKNGKVAGGPETPESAGQAVVDALNKKAEAQHGVANENYGRLRELEGSEEAQRTVQTGVQRNEETGRMEKKYETFQFATDVAPAKNALKPILTRIEKWMPVAQQQASPALQALRNLVNGPRYMNATDVDAALSALKNEARGADAPYFKDLSQGLASKMIGQLEKSVSNALEEHPEAADALKAGRTATKEKYAVKDVLDQLSSEPVKVFDKLVTPRDTNVGLLRDVVKHAPDVGPTIGRAYQDQLLDLATREGGFNRATGMAKRWLDLGNETKKLLVPNDELRGSLDKFWLYAKAAERNPNPSGTAYVGGLATHGAFFFVDPMTHVGYEIVGGSLAKLMRSPSFVKLLTKGMTVKLGGSAGAATAAQLLDSAGDAAVAVKGKDKEATGTAGKEE